jgi:hypothetical protein
VDKRPVALGQVPRGSLLASDLPSSPADVGHESVERVQLA